MVLKSEKTDVQTTPHKESKKTISETIDERQTEEFVVALCGAIGSGVSTIASAMEEIFNGYSYDVKRIKVSELIKDNIDKVEKELRGEITSSQGDINIQGYNNNFEDLDQAARVYFLQSAGNAMRKKYSEDILTQLSINEIAITRKVEENNKGVAEQKDRPPRRHITIIDSLKHPGEAKLFQTVYRDMFYLFGVLCPEHIRVERLIEKKIPKVEATQLIYRDKSEHEKYGQQMINTILNSDFFISNSRMNIDSIKPGLKRFIRIMLGDNKITPTLEENAMFHAKSASVKSGCLSRQIGAAITEKSGAIIATGCNDVPRSGGGLYTAEDGKNDNRCMYLYGEKCKNSENKQKLFDELKGILNNKLEQESLIEELMEDIETKSELKNITEFCRAIHAEMDAIISASRNNSVSLKDATLFSTTFPCHNCAKHIIASGISRVYYIEPYEKSKAFQLHQDAISFDSQISSGNGHKVAFMPFEGVSPKKYLRLFDAKDRKQNGIKLKDNKEMKPKIPVFIDTRYEYEAKIVEHLYKNGFQKQTSS